MTEKDHDNEMAPEEKGEIAADSARRASPICMALASIFRPFALTRK